MTVPQAMLYNHAMQQPSMAPFTGFEETWTNESAPIPTKRYWDEETRRSPGGIFPGAYISSDLRTTITPVDSPSYPPHMLPGSDVGMLRAMATNAHIPRGFGLFDSSSSSTDSEDAPEPVTASAQWNQTYHRPYYSERASSPQYMSSRSNTNSPEWTGGLNLIPTIDSHTWQSIGVLDSPVTPYSPQQNHQMTLNGGLIYRISPVPSPSPPPFYNEPVTISSIRPAPSARPNNRDPVTGQKKCSHCQATQTPLWRRDPSTFKPLCNACGLYLQQRNRLRPQELIDADADDGNTTDDSDQHYVGPECSHCRTHHTSVWRRSKTGAQLCNACGVYQRLRGKPRPLSLKRNKIKPRSKHPKP